MTAAEIVCIEAHKVMEDRRAMTYGYIEPNVPPHGYGQRGRYEIPYRVKDRDGKPRCRWCLGPVKPPRRSWCSDKCVDEAALRRHWSRLAEFVMERDKGCQLCGTIYDQSVPVRLSWGDGAPYCLLVRNHEVDHIVAVKEGGTDDPENLRLLCVPCHREVTAEQRRRWAGKAKQRTEGAVQHALAL